MNELKKKWKKILMPQSLMTKKQAPPLSTIFKNLKWGPVGGTLSNRETFQKTFFTLKEVRLWQQKAEKTL